MSESLLVPIYKASRLFCWAMVDIDDYPRVIEWKWTASVKDRYAATWDSTARSAILMHRMIMGCTRGDGLEVDHRNSDGFDNRRENLRICTHAQNGQNVRKQDGKTSRLRGVCRSRNGKRWIAQVHANGEVIYLGTFDTEDEAGAVSDDFRREHFTHYVGRD